MYSSLEHLVIKSLERYCRKNNHRPKEYYSIAFTYRSSLLVAPLEIKINHFNQVWSVWVNNDLFICKGDVKPRRTIYPHSPRLYNEILLACLEEMGHTQTLYHLMGDEVYQPNTPIISQEEQSQNQTRGGSKHSHNPGSDDDDFADNLLITTAVIGLID